MFNGEYVIPVFLAGTVMFLIFLFFIVMYVLIYRRRRHEAAMQMARKELEHKNQLLVTKLEEQESAMAYFSREIHDNVSQQADLLMMNLKASEEAETEPERTSRLRNSKAILSHISNDLRNASYSLNGSYIKLHGLYEVLSKEINYIRDSRNMTCNLLLEGRYRAMEPETELLIFRIAQEALHNVTKYSCASNLDVVLRYRPRGFMMEIADDGIGFSIDAVSGSYRTLGLQNMQQRADLMNARLTIDTAPDAGCRVLLELL